MIKNIFVALFRKIAKKDIYAIINLAGLSIGMASFLMIFLYVTDELRFDRHHHDANQVYRLLFTYPQSARASVIHPGVIYDHIDGRVAGVSHLSRMIQLSDVPISAGREPLLEAGFVAVDPAFLDILNIEFIQGDPETALTSPQSIIITETAAERLFGRDDPMGQTITLYNRIHFTVSGITKPNPNQSHFQYNMLVSVESMEALNPSMLTNWNMQNSIYYLKLYDGEKPENVAERIQTILWDVREQYEDSHFMALQPLLDIRLRSGHIHWDKALTGSLGVVAVFSVTALLILFLACFNFVNLSTAGAVARGREIGIRKVLGANRMQLIRQFLSEAFVISFLAMLIALLLVELLLPLLNEISGKELAQNFIGDPLFILAIGALLLITPLLAGSYPAIMMSRFQPVAVIKGGQVVTSIKGIRKKKVQLRMRQVLLLLQFAISTALIVASLTIYWQMRFMNDRNPGFDRTHLMTITNPWDDQAPSRAAWLSEQLLGHPGVIGVSLSHNPPAVEPMNYTNVSFEGQDGRQQLHVAAISCDAQYFKVLRSRIVKGRDFDPDLLTDPANSLIINESAAKRMGLDEPIGTQINDLFDNQPRQVIGIVEDIHYTSLHSSVRPMAFYISPEQYPPYWTNIIVRYREGQSERIVSQLEELWKTEAPQWPLEYHFTDEYMQIQYDDDQRVMTIVVAFAILAILLSVLGLVGLSVYASNTRIKEIGIRKVLGANVSEIIRMVSSEFGILIIVSNLIAWPLAYIFTNRWLENFAYRADIGWLIYVLPAAALYFIAISIVASISFRAATMNPVESLRNPG